MDKDQLLAMAKRVFPQPAKARDEVEKAKEHVDDLSAPGLEELKKPGGGTSSAGNEGLESFELSEGEASDLPPTDVVDKRLKDGGAALDKMKKGNDDLTPNEQLGLEAIVLLFGRPALLVQDGDFGEPPDEWKHLGGQREMLKGIIPSVGRVDLEGHHSFPWCGTAWLVGDGVAMTNKHVASIFAAQQGKEWKITSGVKAKLDYKEEFQRDVSNEFKVAKVLGVHPTYDLALLSVAKKGGKGTKAPSPLMLASKAPRTTKDADVVVIGYPAFDSRNGRTEQMDIFKNIFNVKRLQPGKSTGLKQTPQILGHDCSTLGGNSGSCVVDLETGNVIGLHFGGQYLKGNVSVPLWKLADDPFLKKHKLNWV
jgi:glutamyl endopeptidase